MSKNRYKDTDIMTYLAACALNDISPEKCIVEEVDLYQLYKKAARHSMSIIICMALEKGGFVSREYMDEQMLFKWKALKRKSMEKILVLEAERSKVQWVLEQKGIWYMPLKGSVLKNLYPKLGMREMTDIDILFDSERAEDIKAIMVDKGYKVSSYGTYNHDVYVKYDAYCFEFHKELFDGKYSEVWNAYYKNIREKLLKDTDNDYGYHFSNEDFYIYMVAHAYKHYSHYGVGIRVLMDQYVYLNNKQLDWEYIDQENKKLGIAEFEKCSRWLANKIFSKPNCCLTGELSEEEQEMLGYIQESGVHGTRKNWAKKELKQIQQDDQQITGKTKLKYYKNKVFMNMEWYKKYKPFLYKHPWAIPFFVVYRFVRALLFRRDKIKRIINAVEQASENIDEK